MTDRGVHVWLPTIHAELGPPRLESALTVPAIVYSPFLCYSYFRGFFEASVNAQFYECPKGTEMEGVFSVFGA